MSEKVAIFKELQIEYGIKNAREISTYKGGGDAIVARPDSVEKLCECVALLKDEKVKFAMLAKGSNTLVSDGLCETVLIDTKGLKDVEICGEYVYALCGASVRKVVEKGREKGLCGLEFLSGAPCSVGGVVKMNASAFSTQTSDYVDELYILNLDCANCNKIESGNEKCKTQDLLAVDKQKSQDFFMADGRDVYGFFGGMELGKTQDFSIGVNGEFFEYTGIGELIEKGVVSVVKGDKIDWGYRKGAWGIVLGAKMKLIRSKAGESQKLASFYLEKRREKQPALPSLGSVFKNGKIASGKLIEACGLKGMKIGGAMISEKHANFVVNVGGGSASDYVLLANECKRRVFERFGVELEEEYVRRE